MGPSAAVGAEPTGDVVGFARDGDDTFLDDSRIQYVRPEIMVPIYIRLGAERGILMFTHHASNPKRPLCEDFEDVNQGQANIF